MNENDKNPILSTRREAEWSRKHLTSQEIWKLQKNTNAADCEIYLQHQVWLIKNKDGVILVDEPEFINPMYQYFRKALYFIEIEKREAWKTVDALITMSSALRETLVQGTGAFDEYESSGVPLSETEFNQFVLQARHYDAKHHGYATF